MLSLTADKRSCIELPLISSSDMLCRNLSKHSRVPSALTLVSRGRGRESNGRALSSSSRRLPNFSWEYLRPGVDKRQEGSHYTFTRGESLHLHNTESLHLHNTADIMHGEVVELRVVVKLHMAPCTGP